MFYQGHRVSSEVSLVPFIAQCVDSIRQLSQHGYVVMHMAQRLGLSDQLTLFDTVLE